MTTASRGAAPEREAASVPGLGAGQGWPATTPTTVFPSEPDEPVSGCFGSNRVS